MYSVYSVYSVLCTVSCCPETGQSRSWPCSGPLPSVGSSVSAKCPIICFAAWTVSQCHRVIHLTALCHIVNCSALWKYPSDFKCYYLIKDMYIVHGKPKKCDLKKWSWSWRCLLHWPHEYLIQANLLCRFCVTLIASILDTFMYGLNVPCQNVRLVFSVAWCKHTWEHFSRCILKLRKIEINMQF